MSADGLTPSRRRRTLLPVALATAAAAVALPVSAALAGGGGDRPGGGGDQRGTALPVQERPDRPDRDPCSEGERGGSDQEPSEATAL